MFALTAACALLSLSVLFYILGYIFAKGCSSLSWSFLVHLPKPAGELGGGIANSIVGSIKIVGLASLAGIPIGVLGGVYLSEFGSGRLGFLIRYASDILNGVPSIVTGLFAYAVVVEPMKSFSGLAGSVALAIIMIPIVLRSAEDFLRLVPQTIREAALALGVPQWKVILRIVIPSAARGIVTASLLAMARIAGETAPLLFTSFGNSFWDSGWLNPMAALPHTIFIYAISPYDDLHRQAWAAALVLMAFVLAVNVGSRLLLRPSSATPR
ncbi:MAG: phosphate ABC transporter permease PstA [Elusimicrobia bacterium]|nr:phosphate ABC transporter permease PstA [Elusimicrobiota bacterium]